MEQWQLTPIQLEILKAMENLGDSTYSEYVLAKEIRENAGIEGNKKAGLGLADIEKVVEYFADNNIAFYAVHLNSANDILVNKAGEMKLLDSDARKRRLAAQKSMSIFSLSDLRNAQSGAKSSKDVACGKKNKKVSKKRTKTEKINIYSDFEDLDD